MPETQTISDEQSGGYLDPVKLENYIRKNFPGQEYKVTQANGIYRLEIPRKLTPSQKHPAWLVEVYLTIAIAMPSILDEKTPTQNISDLGVSDESPPAISDRNLLRLFALPHVFCSPQDVKVDICDISAAAENRWYCISNDEMLLEHIRASNPDTRIISIVCNRSDKPLRITKSSAEAIFTHYAIGPEIYGIFCPFGRKPRKSEAGLGGMKGLEVTDYSDMQYLLGYIEESGREENWTMRQVGVFHRFVPKGPGSLWVFLHAYPDTRVMELVKATIPNRRDENPWQPHWPFMHLLVLSTCLENWRWYLRDLNDEFEDISNLMLTHDFKNHDTLQDPANILTPLQSLEDRALSLTTRLRSSLATVQRLQETSKKLHDQGNFADDGTDFQRICDETTNFESELGGHLENAKLLQERAQEILRLVSLAFNLQNQAMVSSTNRNILHTKDTVDVVTVVTLTYLPASFVTSFLGMNLFVFQKPSGGSGFAVSRQFWVFIALAVPLTILTFGSWYWFSKRNDKKKTQWPGATVAATVTVAVDEEAAVQRPEVEIRKGGLARLFSLTTARRRHTT
ncbi:hypothetical protein GP486_003679 [Trichoglossum hirsutum]|uniref:CorA-like transporter domain-containing protein n=1 Tax=Trichoglossum hirsutum TaxID=265104 RepID=A0A9P8LCL3_9PEZI|nr:hypothetical protein GP486_003679 [Trichoglossum hirsutum]